LTTGIIWAQVQKFEHFGACFCTCALIIWSVLLQGASKTFYEPMVRSVQTVLLSCVRISTISKRTKQSSTRPLSTRSTIGCVKRFMSLWYIWRNSSTYLSLTLTLCQNRSKWDSTWLMSPRSSIGCLQYYFWAYGTFDANRAPILHQE
jgi:hypothetical protein